MTRHLRGIGFFVFIMGCVSCTDYTPELKELSTRYWDAVFAGEMESAYAMLAGSSRQGMSLEEFTQAMSFGRPTPQDAAELYRAFAAQAKLSILEVKAKRKEASVSVILIVPVLETPAEGVPSDSVWNELAAAVRERRVNFQEIRVNMTWIREEDAWRLLFG